MRRIWSITASLFLAAPGVAQIPTPPASMPEHGDTQPVDYSRATSWICRPGVDDGTCSANLDAMTVEMSGARTPATHKVATDAPVDCFYIYPTASLDPTMYSDLSPDESEKKVVHGQAARLTARCRLYVPVYHQFTLPALRWSTAHPETKIDFEIPYRDVRAAWLYYLAHDNQGRGVILVGHSQGSELLRRLIAEEIDGKPAQKRMVAAYLAGNFNLDSGSFHSIMPCARADQTGCLVAWQSYLDTQDGPRFFGNAKPGTKPICVNPAAVSGGRAQLQTYVSKPGFAPPSDPPYVGLVGFLTAECVADAQGAVLRVRIEPSPASGLLDTLMKQYSQRPGWGEHGLDINLVQGNMLDLMGSQTTAWLARK